VSESAPVEPVVVARAGRRRTRWTWAQRIGLVLVAGAAFVAWPALSNGPSDPTKPYPVTTVPPRDLTTAGGDWSSAYLAPGTPSWRIFTIADLEMKPDTSVVIRGVRPLSLEGLDVLEVFLTRRGGPESGTFYGSTPPDTTPPTTLTSNGIRLTTSGATGTTDLLLRAKIALDDKAALGSLRDVKVDVTDSRGKYTIKSSTRIYLCRVDADCLPALRQP